MTRSDFELIASSLKQSRDRVPPYQRALVDTVSNDVAWALTDSNPKFDRARFLKACGVEA